MTQRLTLKDLLGKLGLVDSPPGRRRRPRKTRRSSDQGGESAALRSFETRLDEVLGRRGADAENHFYLIDLDKVRDRLGAKWTRSAESIHRTIRKTIEDRLGANDVYIRRDDVSYLVVFPTLGRKEGQLKSTILGEEIVRRLIGAESTSELVDVKATMVGDDGKVRFEQTPSIGHLLEEIADILDRAAANERTGPAKRPPPSAPAPARLAGDGEPKGPADADGTAGVTAAERVTSPDIAGVRFVFRPLLAVRTKVISTFLGLPIREIRPGRYSSGYDVLDDPEDVQAILDLDMLGVQTTAAELHHLVATGGRSLLALPVHFETLSDWARRDRYLESCATALAGRGNRIVFEMVGLPDGIPQARLLDLVSVLRPRGRAVIGRLPIRHGHFATYRASGLHAVGIDIYTTGKGERLLMREMDRFVVGAKKNQLRTYVHGVRSISLLTAAITTGFDYLAGHALSSVMEGARDIHAFRLEMPYLALTESGESSAGS